MQLKKPSVLVLLVGLSLASAGCGSSGPAKNTNSLVAQYEVSPVQAQELYRDAIENLPNLEFTGMEGDSVLKAESLESIFPAEVFVWIDDSDEKTIVRLRSQYTIEGDHFVHFPFELKREVARLSPADDRSSTIIPELISPMDSTNCFLPAPPVDAVVVLPEVIGGLAALMRQARYTKFARDAGVEGRIYASFSVNEKGEATCAQILSGLPGQMNQQVVGAILSSDFVPGTVNGVPYPLEIAIPLFYRKPAK